MSDTIVKMVFGSHLYGLDTLSSDADFKGVSFQSNKDFILNGPRKHVEYSSTGNNNSKNSSEDIDIEIYTIHGFLKHALDGQTVAMDMLHCPNDKLIESSYHWSFIRENRSKFYSKNIDSFISYALGQAAKYGIRSSRLNNIQIIIDLIKSEIEKDGFVCQKNLLSKKLKEDLTQ